MDKRILVSPAGANPALSSKRASRITFATKCTRSSSSFPARRRRNFYLRNNPSVFFWEAGNTGLTAAHMKDMADVQAQWDPKEKGGRGLGDKDLADAGGPLSAFRVTPTNSLTLTPSRAATR